MDNGYLELKCLQRVPASRAFWDLEKTLLHEIRVSGTVGGGYSTNAKIPHLHVHKPKTVVVETVLVGDPLYNIFHANIIFLCSILMLALRVLVSHWFQLDHV